MRGAQARKQGCARLLDEIASDRQRARRGGRARRDDPSGLHDAIGCGELAGAR